VRPTALVPIWNIAGFVLGAGLWTKPTFPPNK
jgi:demethoxyubiquinone hydroxylase (CLK1/Coq7/Cat5 family)